MGRSVSYSLQPVARDATDGVTPETRSQSQAMFNLRRMKDSDRDHVAQLAVSVEQLVFVDPINDTLAAADPERDCFVMTDAGTIVGFFQIDLASNLRTIPELLELHEVQIDARHQGKGYGKAFMSSLPALLLAEYPGSPGVSLTVNCKNLHAYRLYEFGGFQDTGDLYEGGRSGPQHIMRCDFDG